MKSTSTPKIGKRKKTHDQIFIMMSVHIIATNIHLIIVIVTEWQTLNLIITAEAMIQFTTKIKEPVIIQDNNCKTDLELHHPDEAIRIKEQEPMNGTIRGNEDKIKNKMAKLEIIVRLIQTADLEVDRIVDQDPGHHTQVRVQTVINRDQVHILGKACCKIALIA